MLNIGIMQKMIKLFSFVKVKSNKLQGAPKGEVLHVPKSAWRRVKGKGTDY